MEKTKVDNIGAIVASIIGLIVLFAVFRSCQVQAGTVDTSDCKESVDVTNNIVQQYTRSYVCRAQGTKYEYCVSRENSWFSNQCVRYYFYYPNSNQNS